ncbi:sorbosone dehydrogenase family protein [Cellulomonas sp. JH27-2]|uniref:PQQ-dependent sugar dehydrogenase n=1 Tax=Cellulomonas sp. JH27-2 TaxID=2774139 RepID=UPI00351AC17F
MRKVASAGCVLALGLLAGCTATSDGTSSPTTSSSAMATGTRPASPGATASSTGVATRSLTDVVTGLDAPWGIAFLPSGDAVVTLRDQKRLVLVNADGKIRKVDGPGADQLVDLVEPGGEGGLLGVAVLDATGDEADIALYATTADDNRVLRATLSGTSLGTVRPILTGIRKAGNHDGGQVAVGPDGFLYVTTGDAGHGADAQDEDSLNGKILRLTFDGDPAPGNPFGTAVWTLGHRNVQGIGWAPDGRMFAAEFGQNTWDELNLIEPGSNYGWPDVEGQAGTDGFVDPLRQWATSDASPSGLAVTDDAVYLAALRGERLWRVPLNPDGVGEPQALLVGELGRLRAVAPAPDGSLWVLTNNTDGRGTPRAGDDRIARVDIS